MVNQTCDEACLSRATIGSRGTYFLFIPDKGICSEEHPDDGTFQPCRKGSLLKSGMGSHGPRWRAAKPGYPSVPLRCSVLGATIGHSQAQALAIRETTPLLPVSKIRERTFSGDRQAVDVSGNREADMVSRDREAVNGNCARLFPVASRAWVHRSKVRAF